MSTPFIFITTLGVPAEHWGAARESVARYSAFIAEREPRMLAFSAAFDAARREVALVHVLADAESADAHLPIAHEHIGAGLRLAETRRIEVFGEPGPGIEGLLRVNAAQGVDVQGSEDLVGGFVRHAA
ncbi:hypothetical protein SAMN05428970_0011 [Agromyces sp. CF514]|uniref:hypothetical protein n=1 Tax=Agromyces sp. CF514 TaxID=1881031 RepID=UPI0008E4B565|nr:hypothetical protein [Agromyces sp. CF514]SFR66297.1 hypothetical protein SAMN05428970_0011 [Agromyces sp. CF514]